MKKLITILLVFFAGISMAQVTTHQFNYTVAGIPGGESTEYNGDYTPNGTTESNGYLRWKHTGGNYYIILADFGSYSGVYIGNQSDYAGGSLNGDYYTYCAISEPLPESPYYKYSGGDFEIVGMTVTDSPLPVELSSFSASVVDNSVKLNWVTATEVNNYGFEIEKSSVKNVWEKVGFVKGNGNSNTASSYSFVDSKPAGSKLSYRLKQVDTDGSYSYSSVEVVELGVKEYSLAQNYPNPFNPSTVISFSLAKDAEVKLAVYNVIGQEMEVLVDGLQTAGQHEVQFNASKLNSGVYFYKIQTADFTQIRKMMLVK